MSDLRTEAYQLRLGIDKSIRYQQRRQAHYEGLHRLAMVLIMVLGSSAVALPFGHSEWLGFVAAIVAALELVLAFSQKARTHQMLHREFSNLAAEMAESGDEIDAVQLKKWKAKRIRIEVDEPPIFWAVDCYNEVVRLMGHDGHFDPLPWRKRLLMNWFRFDRIEPPKVASG